MNKILLILLIIATIAIGLFIFQNNRKNTPVANNPLEVEDDSLLEELGYTLEDVAKHNTLEDCWTIKDSKVYEIPYEWTENHPGGQEAFLSACGMDITEIFKIHQTDLPKEILEGYYLGDLRI